MPYVIRHQQTGQVWTAMLTNSYQLTYYGTKNWDWLDEAQDQLADYLGSVATAEPEQWQVIEVDEAQLKRYNVKLKNNPQLQLFLDEAGQAEIRKRAD